MSCTCTDTPIEIYKAFTSNNVIAKASNDTNFCHKWMITSDIFMQWHTINQIKGVITEPCISMTESQK